MLTWHKIEDEKPTEDGLYLWQNTMGTMSLFQGTCCDLMKRPALIRWYGPIEAAPNVWTQDYQYFGEVARGKIRTAAQDGKKWDNHEYIKHWFPLVDESEQAALIEFAERQQKLWKDD